MSIRWHVFYLALIAMLLAALLWQGAKAQRVALEVEREIAAQALYQAIREAPGKYQLVDLRDALEFEDGHLPGAIRLDRGAAAKGASVDRYRRTVIVTEEGDRTLFEALAREFKLAGNLQGGMMQWRMSRLPEVSGLTDVEGIRRGRPG
jgi:rhodanese-related sulfurtransferase